MTSQHSSPRFRKTLVLLALALSFAAQLPISPSRAVAVSQSHGFTFAAGGDFGSLSSGDSLDSLNRLNSSGADFFLGLGDMSVDNSLPGSAWCSQFKNRFDNFELTSGDRDTGGHNDTIFQESNDYDQYLAGCPHALTSPITCGLVPSNCYGKEYYFDYPYPSSLARFIFVSPKIYNLTGVCTARGAGTLCSSQTNQPCTDAYGCWQYHANDMHYNWVAQAIDDARAEGIRWVVVVMHKNCISAGVNTCSMGIDFFDMLVSKKVDLILQAHDESYGRSKQIALGTGCTDIVTNGNGWASYNSNCIVDDGSTGLYAPGKGSVIVIQGNWGRGWDPVNSTLVSNGQNAAEAPYFATLMGQNTVGRGHGFVKYKVSLDRIDVQTSFAGTYQDNFSISYSPYRSHSNISIDNNAQFNSTNGVTQGDGTSSSPYIIQGWEIESGSTGINITNTTAHFVIKTVYLLWLSTGISLLNVTNGEVESSTLINNDQGVILSNSSSTLIYNNTISGGQEGVTFNAKSNNDVCKGNRVSGSSVRGFTVSEQSSDIVLSQNFLTNQTIALSLMDAETTSIASNQIVYSSLGIYALGSQNITVFGNNIVNNDDGIQVDQSSLRVFHNNFISNSLSPPVQVQPSTQKISWNDSYPSGGNFWSDYMGVDRCTGPEQNICTNPDGIGDSALKIDSMDQDHLPLIKPYGPQPSQAPSWQASKTLSVTNVDRDSLTLTWTKATDINGVTGYLVYQDGVLIATLAEPFLQVTGLDLGAAYDFTVQATDAWLNSTVDGPQATVRVLAKGGDLAVESFSSGTVYQGGAIVLSLGIANLGQDNARITSLVGSGDIGTLSTPNIFGTVPSGTIGTYDVSVSVPVHAATGNHTIVWTIAWQHFDQITGTWASAASLSVSTWLEVKSSEHPSPQSNSSPSPQGLPNVWLIISNQYVIAGISALLAVTIGILTMRRNRSKRDHPQ